MTQPGLIHDFLVAAYPIDILLAPITKSMITFRSGQIFPTSVALKTQSNITFAHF